MLSFVTIDNLFSLKADLFINASNAKGYMGGFLSKYTKQEGIAEALLYRDHSLQRKAKKVIKSTSNVTLGDTFTTETKLPYKSGILHAITMVKPGQKSTLQTVEKCTINIAMYCHQHTIKTAILPLLGTGTGRLPKEEVKAIFRKHLVNHDTNFIVPIREEN